MRNLWVVAILFGGVASAQPTTDPLVDANIKEPEVEVYPGGPKPPPIPSFDVPAPFPDGAHRPKALRVATQSFLGRELTVRGVITWAYNCLVEVRKPGMTEKAAQTMIDADPTLCERAKFYVGDARTTPAGVSLWVVDVPRPYTKLDLKRLKKVDRDDPGKCEPNETDAKKKICPPYKVGDEVEITGTFSLSSPHSERNSDGLLVFKSMRNVTQKWHSPSWAMATPWTPPPRPPSTTPPSLPTPKPIVLAKVRKSVREESVRLATSGTRAYGQRQWDTALELYGRSVAAWRDNHSAWYGMAAAHAQKRDWLKARDAARNAVTAHPTAGMYRLMFGRTIYEAAIAGAKEDQARRQNLPVDQIEVDLSTVNFEKAQLELGYALVLDARLWRAHYLIGSIHRFGGRAKDSAASYSKAIELGATELPPFIALAELYRAWDHAAIAIQVAEQGTQRVPDATAQSDLWFEIGMGYDDQRLDDRAIAAFDKAIDASATNYKARFARGQAYFRKGVFDKSKVDLELFLKNASPTLGFFTQQASRMLMDIATKPPKR